MLKYKVAKIITTSFCPRVVRESAELTGNPLGYFSHSQKFTIPESIIDLINLNNEDTLHAHGGVGLSSTKVLNNLYKKSGNLPYAIQETSQDYEDIIRYGEVNFTNKISKLGYRLINIPSDTKLYSFAYDEMIGITVERYATFYEKMQYFIKLYFYKIPYIRAIFRRLS